MYKQRHGVCPCSVLQKICDEPKSASSSVVVVDKYEGQAVVRQLEEMKRVKAYYEKIKADEAAFKALKLICKDIE